MVLDVSSATTNHRNSDAMNTTHSSPPGGTWMLGDLTVTRFGYGAMQLAGPWVMGPPADRAGALAVLRDAIDLGITHIDTSDAYGPRITNQLIKEALHPYPESLVIATKVGAQRDEHGWWPIAREPDQLRRQVDENLESLGLETLDLVNLRVGDAEGTRPGSISESFETLAALQHEGLIRHLGVSNATDDQVREARSIAPIVCVQNMYNLAHRRDDELIDRLADEHIAYVPYFPLGGFSPLQSTALIAVAARLDASPMAVALAWLLHRSPNILLIPRHVLDRTPARQRRRCTTRPGPPGPRRTRPDRAHLAMTSSDRLHRPDACAGILNHMVQYSTTRLDASFAALADGTRRGVLEQLGRAESSITDLAERFDMTLTGMRKHVGVLEDAGLVVTEKVGRVRTCRIGARRLDEVTAWIDTYHRLWDARFRELDTVLDELTMKEQQDGRTQRR
jgi:pyridoxine 4-dehydrogenase